MSLSNNGSLTRKQIYIIIVVFFIVLTTCRVGWTIYHKPPEQPQAQNGVIDLSDWPFTEDETVALNGEWEFYPGVFLNPELFSTSATDYTPHVVTVPGSINKSLNDTNVYYGTYRLKILLPDHEENNYGMHFRDISSAASIYGDGSLISQIGKPSESVHEYESKLGTYKTSFYAQSDELDVIIHVANYEEALEGGITNAITLGTVQAVNKKVDFSRTMQLIVAMILIVHSLYAFGLYFITKNKLQKELVYFGLLLVFASFSILLDEDKLLINILPIDATWSLKLLYVSFAGTVYFILRFIKSVFRLTHPLFRVLFMLYSILSLLIFIFPSQFIIYVSYCIMLLNAFSYIFIFIQVMKVIRSGNTDAIYILLANFINLLNVIWGIAININMIDIPYYPFDYLIAIIAFAGFLFKKHMRIVTLNEKQTRKLQAADQMKDEFLANTSHELRNPLHGIINIAQSILMNESESLTPKNKAHLKLLVQIGQRMTFTLNDLLDVKRLDDQRIQLKKEPLNLQTVISGVIDMLQFMTGGKDIKFHLNISKDFPNVNADENRLIQILFNLIHNAIKYTNDGTITIEATYKSGIATISVIDTGIGIDEKSMEKIFEPYAQQHDDIDATNDGIGLGLHISKQLIQLHGGDLTVQSNIGKGSTFSFTLPVSVHATEEVAATTAEENTVVPLEPMMIDHHQTYDKQPTILLVDDDPINVKILTNILSSKYNVQTAFSGEEALALIRKNNFDLVIADVMMPNMSGYTLTKKIRENFSISELPILLLTARHQLEDIYSGFSSGANDYVSKPVDALELQARVHALTTLTYSVAERLRFEAAWLQAQIKPHFLFNTLNTIASLGEFDTKRMLSLIEAFGNYLRKSFDVYNTNQLISIDDELALTKSYLYIEQERFGNRLQIDWDVNHDNKLKVPPMSIQTLVENAVNHGILKLVDGGKVSIHVTKHEDDYEISVHDNGVGMTQEKIKEILSDQPPIRRGIGIVNTNRRLTKIFGKGLMISSEPNKGTRVSFRIPKNNI